MVGLAGAATRAAFLLRLLLRRFRKSRAADCRERHGYSPPTRQSTQPPPRQDQPQRLSPPACARGPENRRRWHSAPRLPALVALRQLRMGLLYPAVRALLDRL